MKKLMTAKGLGDAIWLRALVLHYIKLGETEFTVFTRWADVFSDLKQVTTKSLTEIEDGPDLIRFACSAKSVLPPGKGEFQMRCERLGLYDVELRVDWPVRNKRLVADIRKQAGDRKIFIYQPRKVPKTREMYLLRPQRHAYNRVVAKHADHFRIKLGHPPFCRDDDVLDCELDLYGKGYVLDSLDVCTIGDVFFGEPCFTLCMAEALDRKMICMYSRRAAQSSGWIAGISRKPRHKPHLVTTIFDEPEKANSIAA